MKHRNLATLLVVAGLVMSGACTRDKPALDIPIDAMPKVLTSPVAYPPEARANGEQGIVQVRALVGKDGRVTKVSVVPAQAVPAVLKKAALEAVRQWTFEPARSKGEPCAVWIVVPVAFRLM